MLEIGSVLGGKYKILSEIGHGGMSVVYMALNEVANKTWAVKEIRKDGKMDFNVVRQGLVAEIETLKKLKHPNLPSIVDVIEDEDSFIIVMDYIEGNSLDKSLIEHGAQPQELVIEWAMQLCDVLAYLHSCDPPIIYRDMKPANIMLKPDGNIALIDFGTAKTYEIDLGETTGIGTIGYAAPEQYIGSGLGRTDARTDIYCLGITLYHLLTGIDPCKVVIADKSIRAVNPSLSPGLEKIIIKCTEQDPKDRYQSCEELLYDLEHHHELGDAYRKKQRKKLGKFIMSVVATFVFAAVSVWGFISAENAKNDDYEASLDIAKASQSWSESCGAYLEAISVSPEREDAYLKMIDLFKESESDIGEFFSEAESSRWNEIETMVLDESVFGGQSSLKPLNVLQSENSSGYIKICKEIGLLYWYYYQKDSDRYKKAADWFEKVKDLDADANIMYDIAKAIPQIEEQQIGVDVSVYIDNIRSLYDSAANEDDKAMQKLILKEIVTCLSSIKFLERIPSGSEREAVELLNDVENALLNSSLIPDSEERAEVKEQIEFASGRIEALIRMNKGGGQQ
ncbi:MAG: serine/threonine protein kinase [Clostridia bacterium]|nr:serine/threonine protein kinase [Clostridia bacterium]